MLTIRQAINMYYQHAFTWFNYHRKLHDEEEWNFDYFIRNFHFYCTIPLTNGIYLFFKMTPKLIDLKSIYEETYDEIYNGIDYFPKCHINKNGVYRHFVFEIQNDGIKPNFPDSIKKFVNKSMCNETLYWICEVNERTLNEFLLDNGGINKKEFENNLKYSFEKGE